MCIICVFKDIEQKEEQQRIATVNPKMEYKFLHRKQCIATRSKSKKKNKHDQDIGENWRVHGKGNASHYEDAAELQEYSMDSGNYARTLCFPEPFAEFLSHLDPVETQERLNRSLPVSLWKHILTPISKAMKLSEGEK